MQSYSKRSLWSHGPQHGIFIAGWKISPWLDSSTRCRRTIAAVINLKTHSLKLRICCSFYVKRRETYRSGIRIVISNALARCILDVLPGILIPSALAAIVAVVCTAVNQLLLTQLNLITEFLAQLEFSDGCGSKGPTGTATSLVPDSIHAGWTAVVNGFRYRLSSQFGQFPLAHPLRFVRKGQFRTSTGHQTHLCAVLSDQFSDYEAVSD